MKSGVTAESILQAVVDLVCVTVTGLVARALYSKTSPAGVLTPTIYPLTLVMLAICPASHCSPSASTHLFPPKSLRFHPHLPACHRQPGTSILLAFLLLTACCAEERFRPRLAFAPQTLRVIVGLAAFWLAWHHWIGVRFASNQSEAGFRWKHNVYLLLNPLT